MLFFSRIGACLLAATMLAVAPPVNAGEAGEGAGRTAASLRLFESEVRPVLVARCGRCHGEESQKAGLRLDSLVGMLRGGDSGPAIVPGDPEASHLLSAVRHESWEMPPDGRLDERAISAIEAWIASGSPWPGERSAAEILAEGLPGAEPGGVASPVGPPQRAQKGVVTDADRAAWAYQPVVRPVPPARPAGEGLVDGLLRAQVANPIDLFVLARLAEAQVEPLPAADRETLVRRIFLDLLGLPPTPADVASFLADSSPDAYEKLVDRLLRDPRHGERWARHWLDLARYAESDGFRQDAFRPTAWRYRDYVVDAFAVDKPFDRFVMEQLAGDELFPDDAAALIATGFLRQTPYEYNQVDAETQWSDILGEVTDVTADVFLAMGMGCAKCHDHKFDPLLQRDYFAFQAFFAGISWQDSLPLPPPAQGPRDDDAIARAAAIERELSGLREDCRELAAWKGLSRFPPEVQAIVFTPAARRTPHQEQIAQLAGRQLTFDPAKLPDDQRAAYERLTKELADLAPRLPRRQASLTVADVGPEAAVVTIPGKPKAGPIDPRVPEVLGGIALPPLPRLGEDGEPLSSGRRGALARWIASPDNPLTARVMVNRLWQWHFGRGLVATTSDFGILGEPATHPELLDWLAAEFVASGWSVRHIDRLIVTSAAYRRASFGEAPAAIAADPGNRLLWRHDARRLDADQVRDAALAIAEELEHVRSPSEMSVGSEGGPSVPASKPRRSLYTRSIRNTRDPLADAFDAPDGYGSCPERNCTTTPTQALYLANGDWMLERARALALVIERSIADDETASDGSTWNERAAAAAIERVTGRRANGRGTDAGRLLEASAFLERQRAILEGDPAVEPPAVALRMPQRAGLAAAIDSESPAAVLRAGPGRAADGAVVPLPDRDFTIEAHVLLQSLFSDATVRTIASCWTGGTTDAGWCLGVTSAQSRYTPRNLILQVAGGKGGAGYEVIPSGVHLELDRPYFVAASVRIPAMADPETKGTVRFFVKDLSDNDAPLVVRTIPHSFFGSHASPRAFAIGGRDNGRPGAAAQSLWDGLIDDVRLSGRALEQAELLYESGDPGDAVAGYWRFEETPGFTEDSSPLGRALVRDAPAPPKVKDLRRHEALVDLCHVLFNSSGFLYVD
jgi:hypothetical protein